MKSVSELVGQFTKDVEVVIREEMTAKFRGEIDGLLAGLGKASIPEKVIVTAAPAAPTVRAEKRTGPPAGSRISMKTCPVEGCTNRNKARRYSYLCDTHRTPDNIKLFKGSKADKSRKMIASASVPEPLKAKRGPGRPRKNATTKKVAASSAPAASAPA